MAIEYDPSSDHYTALGVGSTAPHDAIKKAHRALIRELHPDRGGEAMSAAQVNIARDVLLDPVTRQEYDHARRDWHQQHPLVSLLTDAGQQLYREYAEAHEPTADRTTEAAPDVRGSSAAHAVPEREPQEREAQEPTSPVQEQPTAWQPYITKALFAGEFFRSILSGRWFEAFGVIGSAHLLDRIIENRIGDDPVVRDVLDRLSYVIGKEHLNSFSDALKKRSGARWDPVARRWVASKPERRRARRRPALPALLPAEELSPISATHEVAPAVLAAPVPGRADRGRHQLANAPARRRSGWPALEVTRRARTAAGHRLR